MANYRGDNRWRLSLSSMGMRDIPRAFLDELRAWADGLPLARFEDQQATINAQQATIDALVALRLERVVAHVTLGVAGASIPSGVLPAVPAGWRLRIYGRVQHASAGLQQVGVRFNGDAGANYAYQIGQSIDASAGAFKSAGQSSLAVITNSNANANRWAEFEATVLDYGGSGHKSMFGVGYDPNDANATQVVRTFGGLWASTAPITSVTLVTGGGNFVAGSTLTVLATPA